MPAADEAFLADNANKEGVVCLPSGLQYRVITEGTGQKPGPRSQVEVHYRGKLVDGREFDSSYKRNETITFPLNGVIAGWTEGLQHMAEGGVHELVIPAALGYGARGAGGMIHGGATLVFEVELIKVR